MKVKTDVKGGGLLGLICVDVDIDINLSLGGGCGRKHGCYSRC